ncbi:MAG: hypothetical protein VX095_08255 [Pseudomonadota bacterium]|nr:hypothetical protein [Pseudomonadota bacterium]
MRGRLGRQAIDLTHLSVMPEPEHHELLVTRLVPNSDNFIAVRLLERINLLPQVSIRPADSS